jgi:Uma2 family endonuclease
MSSPAYLPTKPLTFEEYLAYDDDLGQRYELLESGELLALTNENDINVILAMELYEYLKQFVSRRLIRINSTAIQVTPTTLALPNGRTRRIRQQSRIPDLMVLTAQAAKQIFGKPSGLALEHDNPLLIVKFVSQFNSDEDYTDKRAQYEARGVLEYWIADRHQQQVSVLTLAGDRYTESLYQGDATIHSQVLPAVNLSVNQLLTVEDL